MRLRKPCIHDLYDAHPWDDWGEVAVFTCPGGEFLAESTLVIEQEELGGLKYWPQWAEDLAGWATLDALAVREGEEAEGRFVNRQGMW